jgi:hypothetical protein
VTDMNKDEGELNFIYSGYGRHINFHLSEGDADYLPKVMATFAEFCRAVGFVWVSVDQVPGKGIKGYPTNDYLFRGDYKWDDSTDWAESWYRPDPEVDDDDDDEQVEINQAAESYWDTEVDRANLEEGIEPGDTVYYHGKGTPETTPNHNEEPQGHGGNTGVSLVNMRGKVVKVYEAPTAIRVLVRWDNWNDGHNGMGDDPEARMADRNYWWSNIDNLSVSN